MITLELDDFWAEFAEEDDIDNFLEALRVLFHDYSTGEYGWVKTVEKDEL